jgi:hypothetical protein
MKLLVVWIVITLTLGFKVEKLDRWTVLLFVSLCFADVVFAYLTF